MSEHMAIMVMDHAEPNTRRGEIHANSNHSNHLGRSATSNNLIPSPSLKKIVNSSSLHRLSITQRSSSSSLSSMSEKSDNQGPAPIAELWKLGDLPPPSAAAVGPPHHHHHHIHIHLGTCENDESCSKKAFVGTAECRICQEEDELINLECPCACSGSLKFAHRKCVQRWCNEKGDATCEICLKPYEGGYTAPPSSARINNFPINIGGNSWELASGQRLDMHEPRIFAVPSEHLFSDADYDEYTRANERSAACFRSVALVLMVLLLLRHILSMTSGGVSSSGVEEEAPTFIMLFVLRAAGFFLPCYIMARALNILQCRRQRQALAAAEVAYILQSGQARGVNMTISSPGISP